VAGEGRSEVDVPLDLASTFTDRRAGGAGGVQGELGSEGAWLGVDRGGVVGEGVQLEVACTSCSRCLITLSTLTSTPSTLPAMGRASASSLWCQPSFLEVPLARTSSSSRCPLSSPGLYWRRALLRSYLSLLASSPSSSTSLYLASRVARVVVMLVGVEGQVEQGVGDVKVESSSLCRASTAQTTLALVSTSSLHLSWRCGGKGRGGGRGGTGSGGKGDRGGLGGE